MYLIINLLVCLLGFCILPINSVTLKIIYFTQLHPLLHIILYDFQERHREEEQRKAREVLLRRQKGADSSESEEEK